MKGIFFQKPLEYSLNITGETWKQGDDIAGTLNVKSHAPGAEVPAAKVHLAYGHLKKAHAKDPKAFVILQSALANPEWKFQTDRNAPITDTTHSLFILYGSGDDLSTYGHIQLTMKPYWIIDEFLKELQVGFRFVVKTMKSNKGALDVKVAPPDSRAFAALEQAILSFSFEGELLNISASFDVKKIEATAASVDMKKEKRAFQKSYRALDYLTSSGRFNHVQMEIAMREILDNVEQKILLK
jgi:hypothetical protein